MAAEASAAPAARDSGPAGDGKSRRGLSLRLVRVQVVARRERQRHHRRSGSSGRRPRRVRERAAPGRPDRCTSASCSWSSGPLAEQDKGVRGSIAELGDRIDGDAALRSWEESVNASAWDSGEVWVHGDLLPGNLLVVNGRLSAVIDFGGLNVGDPACDLQPAWNVFAGDSRLLFRAELDVDDASWLRGRGWALLQAVFALPYYWDTNPGMIRQASQALAQVLADNSH